MPVPLASSSTKNGLNATKSTFTTSTSKTTLALIIPLTTVPKLTRAALTTASCCSSIKNSWKAQAPPRVSKLTSTTPISKKTSAKTMTSNIALKKCGSMSILAMVPTMQSDACTRRASTPTTLKLSSDWNSFQSLFVQVWSCYRGLTTRQTSWSATFKCQSDRLSVILKRDLLMSWYRLAKQRRQLRRFACGVAARRKSFSQATSKSKKRLNYLHKRQLLMRMLKETPGLNFPVSQSNPWSVQVLFLRTKNFEKKLFLSSMVILSLSISTLNRIASWLANASGATDAISSEFSVCASVCAIAMMIVLRRTKDSTILTAAHRLMVNSMLFRCRSPGMLRMDLLDSQTLETPATWRQVCNAWVTHTSWHAFSSNKDSTSSNSYKPRILWVPRAVWLWPMQN